MFADRATIIIKSGKVEMDMSVSVVKNTCQTVARTVETADAVET